MRTVIYPYKPGSKSARDLARALGVKRIKHKGSRFRPGPLKTLINWGSRKLPEEYFKCRILNHPARVRGASDKLRAFEAMTPGVSIPEYTNVPETASEWLSEGPVVARTVLNGKGGEGIVVVREGEGLPAAPLYTKYIKKKSEWRVHIFMEEVIMVQKKARKLDVPDEEVNWEIRNHDNGFIYQHMDIDPPLCVIEEASKAVQALGLHFGGVDVIYNEHYGKAYVLEVNSAPGLEGTTLERYVEAVNKIQHVPNL